jgi:hypothetical protein
MLRSSILSAVFPHFHLLTRLGLTPFIKKKKKRKRRNKQTNKSVCVHIIFTFFPNFFSLHFLPPPPFSSGHHEAVPTPSRRRTSGESPCLVFSFSLFHSLPQNFFPPLSPTTTVQLRPPPFRSGHHEAVPTPTRRRSSGKSLCLVF